MNILYVDTVNADATPGVDAKVNAQVRALNVGDAACRRCNVPIAIGKLDKIARRAPLLSDGVAWDDVPSTGFDAYYIRRPGVISRQLLCFLRKLRESSMHVKIVLEIPTYPYDGEFNNLVSYPLLLRDRWNRKKLSGQIDRISCFCETQYIFGVPTIKIVNGIDLDLVAPKRPCQASGESPLNVICVAAFSPWHGVDRAIAGLANYYRNGGGRDVVLHLVGDGPALGGLKRLVEVEGLGSRVLFYGQCGREQMDEVYDRCTFALASLGFHRTGPIISSALKTREYLAKGIPFVYSGETDVFIKRPVDFCLQVPADESPLDINHMVEFHDAMYAFVEEEQLIKRIRRYAEQNVDIRKTMAPIVDYFRGDPDRLKDGINANGGAR